MSFVPSHQGAVVRLVLAAAAWGLGTVVSKRAVDEIPPSTLLSIQLSVSLIVLAVLTRLRHIPWRSADTPSGLLRLGLLNPGLSYALSLIGLTSITASLSVLLWAFEPLMILALAAVVLAERVGARTLVLSVIAVSGLAVVIGQPGAGGPDMGFGIALTVAGVACCAVYTVVGRRWLGDVAASVSTAPVVMGQQAYALAFALGLVLVVALTGGDVLPTEVSLAGWASAVGSGTLYYGAAYWWYLAALRRLPASTAAASFYLIPLFGVAGGIAILGERLTAAQWAGATVALAAVFLILRRAPVTP